MKLLIAYDGSKYSEASLDDLARAGLPDSGEALVVSVADVWLPPENAGADADADLSGIKLDPAVMHQIEEQWQRSRDKVTQAEALARQGEERVRAALPGWNVGSTGTYGSPAWELLAKADDFGSDLILVGSQGRSAIGRLVLGSISQRVVTEAACSVRVGRGRVEVDESPVRLLVAFDGTEGSFAAVDEVASRKWHAGSEIRLIAALEELAPSAVGRFIPPVSSLVDEVNETGRTWLDDKAAEALEKLKLDGIKVEYQTVSGHPKRILTEEAEKWNADCIFMGANRFGSRTERFLLGSTSAAVTARSHCSVEVVRKRTAVG